MTARWVVDDVASERNLKVKWQPISLLFKNEPPTDSPYYDAVVGTHGQLRVMESIRAAEGDDAVFGVYWDFASRIHHDGDRDFDIAKALEELGIDPEHAKAANDEKWDDEIRTRMDEGLALVGTDVGTPIIALNRSDGERVGIFGPVITRAPKGEEALKLWDGMVAMMDIDGFWELKKTRTERPEFGERPVTVPPVG
ncbi:disulfide bond formation protein DsbA [Candidatus Poriferisodalis sp.]|uniref:mycothiol-dependent nitroreductase Rv2466c family protein n=1 Tax=Candidatus Poriferisodalis sp. TaxID=3101277 RepID=UPI003B015734